MQRKRDRKRSVPYENREERKNGSFWFGSKVQRWSERFGSSANRVRFGSRKKQVREEREVVRFTYAPNPLLFDPVKDLPREACWNAKRLRLVTLKVCALRLDQAIRLMRDRISRVRKPLPKIRFD
uniref:Uncharacterized protein n=1 Tax=Ananas comosus var. bracteatus TaxID=296719 RepID=A0A6V7Q1N7_ANACO|nr:unnamed protein product [Ananas comosus var. bracteatus]